jgi:hypothetical protein
MGPIIGKRSVFTILLVLNSASKGLASMAENLSQAEKDELLLVLLKLLAIRGIAKRWATFGEVRLL